MTRIVSGRWGGRRLQVPKDDRVRPTAERVREAWLAILEKLKTQDRVAAEVVAKVAPGLMLFASQ